MLYLPARLTRSTILFRQPSSNSPSRGSTPGHITPSLMPLMPLLFSFIRSSSSKQRSQQGGVLATRFTPWKILYPPFSSQIRWFFTCKKGFIDARPMHSSRITTAQLIPFIIIYLQTIQKPVAIKAGPSSAGLIIWHQFYYRSFLEQRPNNQQMSLMEKYSAIYKLVPNHSSANLSSSFRNSGRNDLHAFGARYQRPMHDLDYTKPILQHSPPKNAGKDHSKSQSKRSSKNPEKVTQFRIKSVTKSQSQFRTTMNSIQGVKASNYFMKSSSIEQIPVQSRQAEIVNNMQRTTSTISMNMNNNKSSPALKAMGKFSTFGLSECELEKTIMGKIVRKSSHHLDFGKAVDRPVNVNKIWYNKDETYSPVDREKNNIKDKIHYFKSDSPHKAFEVGTPFDKNYDAPVWIVKKRTDAGIRSLDKVKSRPGLEIKLGTNLDYEKDRSLENKKRPIFEIAQTDRKLTFTRQVISPKKGVYR